MGGGGDVTSLPDPGWATTPVYPARFTPPVYALVPAPRQFLVLPLQAQVHDPLEPHQFDAIRVRTEVRRLHAQPVANR
jgi:hypothetical protein